MAETDNSYTYSSEEVSDYYEKSIKADLKKEKRYSINKPWKMVIRARILHD